MADGNVGDTLRDLEAEASESEKALLPAWRAWASAQAEYLESELLREGQATGQKQSAVSVRLDSRVSELREELALMASGHRDSFEAWGAELTEPPNETSRSVWDERVEAARVAFGKLFVRYGYKPNDLNPSRQWTNEVEWEFYNPRTGTGRARYLPPERDADVRLDEARKRASRAARELRDERSRIADEKARELWS